MHDRLIAGRQILVTGQDQPGKGVDDLHFAGRGLEIVAVIIGFAGAHSTSMTEGLVIF